MNSVYSQNNNELMYANFGYLSHYMSYALLQADYYLLEPDTAIYRRKVDLANYYLFVEQHESQYNDLCCLNNTGGSALGVCTVSFVENGLHIVVVDAAKFAVGLVECYSVYVVEDVDMHVDFDVDLAFADESIVVLLVLFELEIAFGVVAPVFFFLIH